MMTFDTDVTFESTAPNELSLLEFSFVTETAWSEVTAAFHRGEIGFNENGRVPLALAEQYCARRLTERVASVLGDRHRYASFLAGMPRVDGANHSKPHSPYIIERNIPIPPLN